MKAEVAFTPLLTAARALKPYTTPPRWHTTTRLLHLHSSGHTLTLSATTGEETAQVDLPGAIADGHVGITPDTLVKALTAMRPKGKAAATATLTLLAEPDRLYLSANGAPTVGLDTDTGPAGPADPPPMPSPTPVTAGPVGDWCDLVSKVAWAAGGEAGRPELAVVRLRRDHPGTVLMVEATDAYRAHRGCGGEPTGDPVDARMPAAAVQRATKLLTACDPHGGLRIDVDDERLRWQTSTVRVYARTRGQPFPNLEKLREDVCSEANIRFTVDRPALLAALDTAAALAATTRRGTLRVEPASGGAGVDVTVYADSGAVLHRTPVPIGGPTRPAQALTFKPAFARQAIAFLDGPTVAVAATIGRLAVYLHAGDRHAIVMQTAA